VIADRSSDATEEGGFLAPVAIERVSDVIATRIADAIRRGELETGARLPTEHQLAERFGVGRTSVREALQKLRTLGLIEVRKGLGAHVTVPRFDDPLASFVRWTTTQGLAVEELIEARISLETTAAALAAVRSGDDDMRLLVEHRDAHAAAADSADLVAMTDADAAFHETIVAGSRNQFVARMYSVLITELTDFRRRTLALPWAPSRSVQGHARIVEAIQQHDPRAAREAMLDHLYVLYTEVAEAMISENSEHPPVEIAPREALT